MILTSLLSLPAGAQEAVSTAPPRTPAEEKAAFHLPEGFEAQLVAAEPEIHKPLNIAFDDRGRLWLTDTLEYPFPAQGGKTPRDGVKILSDFGPDGRARKVTTFTSGLNIPIGVLPMPGGTSALVHSIPNVLRIDEAGKKEPVYQTYGAKDTHGMTNAFTWGFDGWVYACHGFSNESTVAGADKRSITMQSGNVYRMRPDGSHLEYVTHGQVNPFGLAFDPLGNLYSCDCHSKPIYQLLRGAYYPSFGKPDDGLGFGPTMTTHDHGSTAISGIVYYAADHFPKAYLDTAFIGNVVTNRINHDRIEWRGATPKAIPQPDFLVSDDPWFRPVDIELGPDGALYVADFYNRIIGHYEVPLTHPGRDRERGRIWRIVYKGKDGKTPPAPSGYGPIGGESPGVDALNDQLGDPNLAVRTRAANRLVALISGGASASVEKSARDVANPWRRVHALWVLERVGTLK
ncbi:MAG: dehydrogenase, partial [Planctomycetia bacterium]|nr:dehydrogenase [Planctomycetia bacterium]